jgi:hypothetical protein
MHKPFLIHEVADEHFARLPVIALLVPSEEKKKQMKEGKGELTSSTEETEENEQ